MDVITDKLTNSPKKQETWRKSVTSAALKCLIAAYTHSKDQATSSSEQEKSILERLQQLLVGLCSSNMHVQSWLCASYAVSPSHRPVQRTSLRQSGSVSSRVD